MKESYNVRLQSQSKSPKTDPEIPCVDDGEKLSNGNREAANIKSSSASGPTTKRGRGLKAEPVRQNIFFGSSKN